MRRLSEVSVTSRSLPVALLALAVLLTSPGCSSDSAPGDPGNPKTDLGPSPGDLGGDGGAADGTTPDNGLPPADLGPDATSEPDLQQPRGYREPCRSNTDCESGWCVPYAGAYVCTRPCEVDCADGWFCRAIANAGSDPVFICMPPDDRLCAPCIDSSDCAGGVCLTVDPRDQRRYCVQPCLDGACREGFECQEVATGEGETAPHCLPSTGTCTCTADNDGLDRLCSSSNAEGACLGRELCVAEEGWIGCDAPAPTAERCNQRDDNCDGFVDNIATLGQPCERTAEGPDGVMRCSGTIVCVAGSEEPQCTAAEPQAERCNLRDDDCDGAVDEDFPTLGELCQAGDGACQRQGALQCAEDGLGLRCSAAPGEPVAEACNYVDDDCDGETDEDFRDAAAGAYVHPEHCGLCGRSCEDALPNASATCALVEGTPTCVVQDCEPGYYPAGPTACLPFEDPSCRGCASDQHCLMPGNRCLDLDGGRFCGRDCAAGNLYGTPEGWCPEGFLCAAIAGLEPGVQQCLPVTDSCTCREESDRDESRACLRAGEAGTCLGNQACDPAQGWSECSAREPAAETCNGLDDDCDGQADEDVVTPEEPCVAENEAGACGGEWTCAGAEGWRCSAQAAAPETCNGRDDDCDGDTDEGFRDAASGLYLQADNCGLCGFSCAGAVPFATEAGCAEAEGQAACVALSCEEGYRLEGAPRAVCLPEGGAFPCSPCLRDEHCAALDGGRCVLGPEGGTCAAACAQPEDCAEGFVCEEELCRPRSGSCTCLAPQTGDSRLCFQRNEFGTCLGLQNCDAERSPGWSECDSPVPGAELCNGQDDDCDGLADEGALPPGGPACENSNEFGTCPGQQRCEGAQGWRCDAPVPAAESCNGVDDDCDGQRDEPWLDPATGLYLSPEHCGACGFSCEGRVANARTMDCVERGGLAQCVVRACEPGFFQSGDLSCVPVTTQRCAPCRTDRNCAVPGDRCLTLDGAQVCGQDCSEGNLHGTAAGVCPFGFVCQELGEGIQQCVPQSGSCTCLEEHEGDSRLCQQSNELGTCTGLEVCDPTLGFSACSAPLPTEEACDRRDNDCDGEIDEGFVELNQPCTEGEGACRRFGVVVCAADGGGTTCSVEAARPKAEICNYLDDDCDGETDEDFRSAELGVYLDDEHCGACNRTCEDAVPFATATECRAQGASASCVAVDCEAGFRLSDDGRACVPLGGAFDCSPCRDDAHCEGLPDGLCERFDDGRFCTRSCVVAEDCPEDYDCRVGRCWPRSLACTCTDPQAGDERACFVDNEFGTCVGTQVCDPLRSPGWSACSAGAASAEVCDGRDNDCDGLVDEGVQPPDGPECERSSDAGTCTGRWLCEGESGWTCSAQVPDFEHCNALDDDCDGAVDEDFPGVLGACFLGQGICRAAGQLLCTADGAGTVCNAQEGLPQLEQCNGVDDDCDGETDEDFRTGDLYTDFDNCGRCGLSCARAIPNASARCDATGQLPSCVVEACAPGYVQVGPTDCVPVGLGSCEPCVADASCLFPGARCEALVDGHYCLNPCAGDADCAPGTSCQLLGDTQLCVPATEACLCDGSDTSVQRGCEVLYEPALPAQSYSCFGRQVCEQDGWSSCALPDESCNNLDDDCDGETDEGFLDADGRYSDDENCGACGNNCRLIVFPGGAGSCNTFADPPRCSLTCGENCFDLNANPADGCECCDPVPTDFPDPLGFDANCDGVDGEVDNAIFVAKDGDDANPGTLRQPKRTVQAGLQTALAETKRDVYVATGVYEERIQLVAGVGLYGGYSADFRVRDALRYEVAILGPAPTAELPGAVNALDLTGGAAGSVVFDGFSVYGFASRTSGASSYALYLRNVDASLRVSHNRVHAGRGGPGARGRDGEDGADGLPGQPGRDALDLITEYGVSEHDCQAEHHSAGGAPGIFSCGDGAVDTSGGRGGNRVCPTWAVEGDSTAAPTPEERGVDGASGGGLGGEPGWDVYHQAYQCVGYATYGIVEGRDGGDGSHGEAGVPGAGCEAGDGQVQGGLWWPGLAQDGTSGLHGRGGGGGGSGAGAYVHTSCFSKGYGYDNLGGSGGGGGSGGCGGTAGSAGTGGGGAFALFLAWDAAPAELPTLAENVLYGGVGGPGGDGGNGGTGGSAGPGALGGRGGGLVEPVTPTYPAFKGGKGGNGGNGGHGAGGGGGCGGPTYGIYAALPPGVAAPMEWTQGNAFESLGEGGAGGLGGFSLGEPGLDGREGLVLPTNF